MHILYLDDSGSPLDQKQQYFVLGGMSIYESQIKWLTKKMDALACDIWPEEPANVEFHASEIFSRRKNPWQQMTRDEACGVIISVLRIFADDTNNGARAFACAAQKSYLLRNNKEPVTATFEDLCSRFDMYLKRLNAKGDRQSGLLVLDKSRQESTMQKMVRHFQNFGTQWQSTIRNLSDVPFFVDSRMSRMVQLADHIAYAVFRRYSHGDTKYFDIIAKKFDADDDGILHGLTHRHDEMHRCMCPACMMWRMRKGRTNNFADDV